MLPDPRPDWQPVVRRKWISCLVIGLLLIVLVALFAIWAYFSSLSH